VIYIDECKNLIDAIILNAVNDIRVPWERTKNICTKNRLKLERDRAIAWLESKNNSFGSFEWYCDLAGYDPEAIRERVLGRRADEEGI